MRAKVVREYAYCSSQGCTNAHAMAKISAFEDGTPVLKFDHRWLQRGLHGGLPLYERTSSRSRRLKDTPAGVDRQWTSRGGFSVHPPVVARCPKCKVPQVVAA